MASCVAMFSVPSLKISSCPRLSRASPKSVFVTNNQSLLPKRSAGLSLRIGRMRNCTVKSSLFGLGMPELVVIAGVTALVFGPKKLPEIGRSIGKTVKSFQQAAKEFEAELKGHDASAESSSEPHVNKNKKESNLALPGEEDS